MSVVDDVQQLVAPLLADLGLDVYDVEYTGGTVRVTVDRPGGVDLDAIAVATRLISRELDHADPVPGRYTLEVTSPGLERSLRTSAHFRTAVGAIVTVRTRPEVEGDRRSRGVLSAADGDGIVVRLDDGTERRLAYDEIERAKTVFEWGPAARPANAPTHRKAHAS
jgi:ribosome maturation factor RimP